MRTDFRTAGVAPEARAAIWTQGYTRRFAPVCVEPTDRRQFQAELRLRSIGPVTLAWVQSQPSIVTRTKELADQATERLFGFVIQLRGAGLVSHCGHRFEFTPGDVVLNDNTQPMRCDFLEPMEGITVRVSEAVLRARIPFADELRGVRLPSGTPLAATAVNMARSLVLSDDLLPADYGTAVANSLLDIFAMSYSAAGGRTTTIESVGGVRQALVLDFIEAHLHDPSLTPGTISSSLQISPRYLRKLMAQYGETASSYILRRRLEESSKQLRAPLHRDRTVTELAFSFGFNSSAHFARVFKNKYGLSPSDYRAEHAEASGHLPTRLQ